MVEGHLEVVALAANRHGRPIQPDRCGNFGPSTDLTGPDPKAQGVLDEIIILIVRKTPPVGGEHHME
jgi:hypothetical protein